MTRFTRLLVLGAVLLGTQFSVGCYLGLTNRPVLFPRVAIPAGGAVPAGSGCCYSEFGAGGGCGGSLLGGPLLNGPAVSGPVGHPVYSGGGAPGCVGCGSGGGVPIADHFGGAPIAVSPVGPPYGVPVVPVGGGGVPQVMPNGPIHGVPYDSGLVPTVKPPTGGVVVSDVKKVAGK